MFGNPANNYEIELKRDPPITILHGPNGSGKTVIFRMLYGLFNGNYFIFWKYPFCEFKVAFENDSHVIVERAAAVADAPFPPLYVRHSQAELEPWTFRFQENAFQGFLDVDERRQMDERTLLKALTERFAAKPIITGGSQNDLPILKDRLHEQFGAPTWLRQLPSRLTVNLINTKRESIMSDAEDLSRHIREVIVHADVEAKRLDSEFPDKVFRSAMDSKMALLTTDEIEREFALLEKERQALVDDGLLAEQESGFQFPKGGDLSDATLNKVLQIYIDDTKKKLEVFHRDKLADKITEFKSIVTGTLSDKQLAISRDKGFEVCDDYGEAIPLGELSSGEQHLIVLIYTLLFHNEPEEHELVLIDEPELSLHIVWQKRFISDLERIMKLLNFDSMIATHSPAIISGRWELEVGLRSVTAGEQ